METSYRERYKYHLCLAYASCLIRSYTVLLFPPPSSSLQRRNPSTATRRLTFQGSFLTSCNISVRRMQAQVISAEVSYCQRNFTRISLIICYRGQLRVRLQTAIRIGDPLDVLSSVSEAEMQCIVDEIWAVRSIDCYLVSRCMLSL